MSSTLETKTRVYWHVALVWNKRFSTINMSMSECLKELRRLEGDLDSSNKLRAKVKELRDEIIIGRLVSVGNRHQGRNR